MALLTEPCPCCGRENMLQDADAHDICRNCGWEDDPLQREDPDYLGANTSKLHGRITLNKAKELLAEGKQIYEGFPKATELGEPNSAVA